ncbi:GlyGly-CTERM sorting domain-containing protein [Photobacterium sp. SDRW27]|uniref:GlyGly-CTERM sorting domain-containing protein n=1 Tax=Photobacterium obscurum TaxID=2829490 RepID=UPI002244B02E|nr:GlyGly-CTERM sorting domain-containing protein [Photobacterium obscurum]MCW8330162.1 GlyGly-CTERM sorting domain-containing protein [Photobacterium obscurum]
MLKLNMSFLLLLAGSAHAVPLQETEAMAFPKELSCPAGQSAGEAEGRVLLGEVLSRVGSSWQPNDFLYLGQIDGVDSHHLVFNLHHNNVPVEKQELILSIDNNCQLFRYQYRVVDSLPKEDAGNNSVIKNIDEALSELKTLAADPDSSLSRSLSIQASRLQLLNKADQTQLQESYAVDEITGSPLYRIMADNTLVLGYQLNLPSRNPDGVLELWWNSQKSSPDSLQRFPYTKRSSEDAIPALSAWTWQSYEQHPQRTLDTDYVSNFWDVWPPISKSLPINMAGKVRTANLVYLDSINFPWNYDARPFKELWDESDIDGKYKLTSIITNIGYADKGLDYAANTLGYSHLFPAKPGLVLSVNTGSSIYRTAFDVIQISDNGCPASLYDPGAVLHEQGHSIFVRLQPLARTNSVITAINEGFADYWAGGFLRQDSDWDGVLAEFRNDVCTGGAKGAGRQLLTPQYDYFEGMEQAISGSHGGIDGPDGKVFFEPMLAQPLLAAMQDLIKVHGEAEGRKLADHIVLESFAGLSADVSYRELSQALLATARRLDPSLQAEAFYRLHLTNSNLLPRQVEPESRVALVSPLTSGTKITLVNNDSGERAEGVTVAFPEQAEMDINLAASEKQTLILPTPQLVCGEASSQPLTLRHFQDGRLVQDKAYPFTLIGGQQSKTQSFAKQDNSWWLDLSETLGWESDNTRHVLRLSSDTPISSMPKLTKDGQTINLTTLAHSGNTLWLGADSAAELSSGKWKLQTYTDYKSAELLTLDCVPAFTIEGPVKASEMSTISFTAMMDGYPVAVNWQIVGESNQSEGEYFNLSIPNLAESTSYEIEASLTLGGEARTVRHKVEIDAVNQPATFEINAPSEVKEGESVTFTVEALSDSDSEGYLMVEWFIDSQGIGQGNSVQWTAPESDTDKTLTLSVRVRDGREPVDKAVIKTRIIELKHINTPPTISLNAPEEVQAGKLLNLAAQVSDQETSADKLTVSWKITGVDTPALPNGPSLSWTVPAATTATSVTVTAEVSDGETTATATRVINVKPANKAPVLSLTGPANAQAGQQVEIKASWQDETADKVTLNWQVKGQALPFEQLSKDKIRLTIPKSTEAGSVQVQVSANDGEASSTATHQLSWAPYVNQAPTVTITGPAQANVGDQITLVGNAQDPDAWPASLKLTWRQVSGADAAWTANGSSLQFKVPASASDSTLSFEVDAFDGETHTKSQWRIEVAEQVIPHPVIVLKDFSAEQNELSELVLDASGSTGVGTGILSFNWKQLSGPSLSGFPQQGMQIKTALPEVSSSSAVELELTVSEDSRESRKVIRFDIRDIGPTPIDVETEVRSAGSKFMLEADSLAELQDGVDYQFKWEQVKGPEVTILEPEARTLTVGLPSSSNEEELGFALTITTPGKGTRQYAFNLKVAAAPAVKPEEAKKPQESSKKGGGSGGSINFFGLLALFGVMWSRKKKN